MHIPSELGQHIETIISKFLTTNEVTNARMRDAIANDYDSRIIRFDTDTHRYYLIETDHVETDAAYQTIASANGQTILRKVPMRAEVIPPYPQKTPEMKHDFANHRDDWEFVYQDKTSHLLYCLYEVN